MISADGQEPVTIELTGHADDPDIITNPELIDSVKFVPYFAVISTDNIYDWNKVSFRFWGGRLPEGVSLDPETGELYGVPSVPDDYEFSICADFSCGSFASDIQNFKLTVLDNSNANDYNATDLG